jgi:hypothetical protein
LIDRGAEVAKQNAFKDRIRNCTPSVIKDMKLPDPPAEPVTTAALDEDLRRDDWWPIEDQKNTGACVGFGVGGGLVRWNLVTKGPLKKEEKVSTRYFWMAAKEMDEYAEWPTTFIDSEGTSIFAALRMAHQFGCLLKSELDMDGPLFQGSRNYFLDLAGRRKIKNYHQLEFDLDEWVNWLRTHGPLAVRTSVDPTFERASAAKPNLDSYKPYPDPAMHGHAITLVGYISGRFIIRNSWGTDWGEKGYAYASRDYAAQAFSEAWGIYLEKS